VGRDSGIDFLVNDPLDAADQVGILDRHRSLFRPHDVDSTDLGYRAPHERLDSFDGRRDSTRRATRLQCRDTILDGFDPELAASRDDERPDAVLYDTRHAADERGRDRLRFDRRARGTGTYDRREHSLEVRNQILGCLEPDREAQEVIRNRRGRAFRTLTVFDEALPAAQ